VFVKREHIILRSVTSILDYSSTTESLTAGRLPHSVIVSTIDQPRA